MSNIADLNGKSTLVFVLEYNRITGGMLHSVTSLITQIHHKFNIIVICPAGSLADYLTQYVRVIEVGDIELWHSKNIFMRLKLLRQLKMLFNSFKLLQPIVVTNNIYAQLLTAICSYFFNYKTIYFNRGGNLKNSISRLTILLSHRLNLVICTSTNQQQIVNQSGLLKHGAKSLVLSNPVELTFTENKTSQPNSPFIIGIVGYIDVGKNQLLALDALAELRKQNLNVCLHLYGEANNKSYLNSLNRKIEAFNLTEAVEFKGFVEDKNIVYNDIDLLLSTSIAEGFGRTLVEAMLAKKPVVALTIAGGPADIIPSKEYGMLVDDNSQAVASAIKEFMCNPQYKSSVIEKARNYADTTFNPATIANNFVSILEREVL